jgi:hypothetical protein
MKTATRFTCAALLALASVGLPAAPAAQAAPGSFTQAVRHAGERIAHVAKKFGHALARDTRPARERIKIDAQRFGHTVAHTAQRVGHTVAHRTGPVRSRIKHDARRAGHAIAHGAKSFGHAVEHAAQRLKQALHRKHGAGSHA